MFDTNRRLVFAHRGGALRAPENTMPAIDNGLRLVADGLAVVIHDRTLDRTTDRTGPVQALTANELAGVDAGFHFKVDDTYPFRGQGIGVPRLEEVVTRHPDARLIIEMKDDSEAIAEAVLAVLERHGAIERAMLASFHQRPIHAARRLNPLASTGASSQEVRKALYASWAGLSPRKPVYRGFQIPEKSGALRIVSPRFVRAVSKAGLSIAVWTVNEEADMRRLLQWGVDSLITDRPDLAVNVATTVV